MSNFASAVQSNQREVANNSALAISRDGSLNRRGGANASALHNQIQMRQKNSSENSMHANGLSTL